MFGSSSSSSAEAPQIQPLNVAPPHLSAQEHDAATSATPASFADIPPRLVLGLQNVTIAVEPALVQGEVKIDGVQRGEMWATESSLSFLPSSGQGFSLPYPLIVLHAVSASVPAAIASSGSSSARRSIYCQIERQSGEDEEGDEDEADGLREMWIVPESDADVDPLFQSLSHCASLHPSIQDGDGEDDDGGNPFAGMGPFGTGLTGGVAGQFDDVNGGADGEQQELSEAGRAHLDRFEAMLGGSTDAPSANDDDDSQSGLSRSSNLLLLRTQPQPYPSLFQAPLLSSLLALLDAYAPVVGWDPSPAEGTMRIVFDNRRSAARRVEDDLSRVQEVLDGLQLEVEGVAAGEEPPRLSATVLAHGIDVDSLLPRGLTDPATSSRDGAPQRSAFAPTDHLQPPNTDRNFLISPPGSPPIGWEPMREDPPNRETLAGDLIEALKRLSGGAREDEDKEEEQSETKAQAQAQAGSGGSTGSTNGPRPGEVKVVMRSGQEDGQEGLTVTVQSFDDEGDDGQESAGSSRPDITKVKATVESMQASGNVDGLGLGDAAGGGKRITPTGRPPLA